MFLAASTSRSIKILRLDLFHLPSNSYTWLFLSSISRDVNNYDKEKKRTFNSFWVASSTSGNPITSWLLGLSILSELHQTSFLVYFSPFSPPFNSFWVASRPVSLGGSCTRDRSFQFFLSCISSRTACLWLRGCGSFNSFWVASRNTGRQESVQGNVFQFFLSCILYRFFFPNVGFRFTFNSFWVASQSFVTCHRASFNIPPFNSFWVASFQATANLEDTEKSFQFFLSCIKALLALGGYTHRHLPFNSFWVASG